MPIPEFDSRPYRAREDLNGVVRDQMEDIARLSPNYCGGRVYDLLVLPYTLCLLAMDGEKLLGFIVYVFDPRSDLICKVLRVCLRKDVLNKPCLPGIVLWAMLDIARWERTYVRIFVFLPMEDQGIEKVLRTICFEVVRVEMDANGTNPLGVFVNMIE